MFYRWSRNLTCGLVCLLAIQVCFTLPLTAQTPPTPGVVFSQPIPSTYFGVNLEDIADYPSNTGSLGKGSAVYWPWLEPQKGVFDWSRLDAWANKAKAEGVPFFFSNDYVPAWAAADQSSCSVGAMGVEICRSTVANIADWDDFVNALVTRYNGKIQMYELWNEPNNSWYFSGTVAQMVTLTTHMYNIIRSLDPNALIAAPSAGDTTWLDQYWTAGGVTSVDLVTTHDYPDPTNPVAEVICAFRTIPLKAVMAKHGIQKPIWDTEGSWGGSNTLSNPDQQAAYVARHALLHWACGVARFYWYAWDGADSYPYWGNLWSQSGGLNEAGVAFVNVQNWLSGAIMPNGCLMNGKPIPAPPALFHGVYACNLKRAGGYEAAAIWSTDGPTYYWAASKYSTYRDLAGNSHPLPANHHVEVGIKPILLEP